MVFDSQRLPQCTNNSRSQATTAHQLAVLGVSSASLRVTKEKNIQQHIFGSPNILIWKATVPRLRNRTLVGSAIQAAIVRVVHSR